MNKLTKLKTKAEEITIIGGTNSSVFVDHTKATNPYKSLYGNKKWREVIEVSGIMRGFECIKYLMQHVYNESKRIMEGKEYKENWVFYHDALLLMTTKDTITWMKEIGIYKRWLLPLEINKRDCLL